MGSLVADAMPGGACLGEDRRDAPEDQEAEEQHVEESRHNDQTATPKGRACDDAVDVRCDGVGAEERGHDEAVVGRAQGGRDAEPRKVGEEKPDRCARVERDGDRKRELGASIEAQGVADGDPGYPVACARGRNVANGEQHKHSNGADAAHHPKEHLLCVRADRLQNDGRREHAHHAVELVQREEHAIEPRRRTLCAQIGHCATGARGCECASRHEHRRACPQQRSPEPDSGVRGNAQRVRRAKIGEDHADVRDRAKDHREPRPEPADNARRKHARDREHRVEGREGNVP
eukprot:Amastigsp_a341009_23.p3 type:complete len:290 gc:universal Amastigsp_a341009_23:1018-149(-)